ncbi:KTSC domain-containing protein [Altererythrobacter xixiisoli]|uniref:KTSC domain-containing protein n=2 Tax=Croceibacterium xixiisoli TaxID=1476466 RepID=A0A6I4TST7_9SPHN|nr:KTSC domain-containing protein [Croceibacterium xixiisoli]
MIERVEFDADTQTLCVSFTGTGRYYYYDVPAQIFEGMCAAKSAGVFFNQKVKGQFRCQRDPARRRFGPAA